MAVLLQQLNAGSSRKRKEDSDSDGERDGRDARGLRALNDKRKIDARIRRKPVRLYMEFEREVSNKDKLLYGALATQEAILTERVGEIKELFVKNGEAATGTTPDCRRHWCNPKLEHSLSDRYRSEGSSR